jgi:hypothetical protein
MEENPDMEGTPMKLTNPICWALACSILMTVAPLSAYADRSDRRHHRESWRSDIRVKHSHDLHRWRGGRWVHGHHHRVGWWWVVGGLWYFYPRVIYPYPNPYIPSVMVNPPAQPPVAAPPVQYWYYCEAAKGYYPYVPSCPAGWKMVPAMPSDVPPQ